MVSLLHNFVEMGPEFMSQETVKFKGERKCITRKDSDKRLSTKPLQPEEAEPTERATS